MSNPANPAIVAVLQSIKQFVVNVGTDPVLLPVKFPGALAVLIGQVELQLPVVAAAELGAVQAAVNSKIDGLIASLQK